MLFFSGRELWPLITGLRKERWGGIGPTNMLVARRSLYSGSKMNHFIVWTSTF